MSGERMRFSTAASAGAALLFALCANAHADGFKAMAKELSKAAQRAGIRSVAVVSFEPADASNPREGWNIAEKLTTQIVRQNRVRAVERNLLKKVMGETYLGETGALELPKLRRVGKVLSVEAIVTGSFVTSGNVAIVTARLIDAQSGEIIAAAERTADRDWYDPLGLKGNLAAIPLDPYAFGGPDGEPPLIPPAAPSSLSELLAEAGLRDSPADTGCRDAAERVDRLENSILDLKARYWASRLKDGLSLRSLRFNPGSTITDPLLKVKFYEEMKRWYALSTIPPLNVAEVQRFTAIDQKAFQLYRECGL